MNEKQRKTEQRKKPERQGETEQRKQNRVEGISEVLIAKNFLELMTKHITANS